MNLLDQWKLSCAKAMDEIKHLAAQSGHECLVSVMISHPTHPDGAFVVGEHELDQLFLLLMRLETGDRAESDVTSTAIGQDIIVKGKMKS